MKNRILLENYYLPGQLEQSIEEFVEYIWFEGSGCDCLLMSQTLSYTESLKS
jgi:hypothetical protein